jgi:hypothetical protein
MLVNVGRHMRTARIIALCCFVSLLLLPQAGLGQRERGWELLGTAHVDGAADHDNIKVSRGEQFRQIQLRVRGGAIEFRRVVVHYGNGASEEVQVRQRIPAGGQTRAIDLRGERRHIESLELWYGKGHWRQRPMVELYGR